MLQCFNSILNNETGVIAKFIVFCPTATYKLLTYVDVLRCYGMTMFVNARLARLTSHADTERNVKSLGASLSLI